mmetsp:Transcript_3433/g.13058  ORF Transcript_3433/g.13058 Transcript_3433/m.13058 type:complete len:173 (+) Transcript_3433:2083-2601(+)
MEGKIPKQDIVVRGQPERTLSVLLFQRKPIHTTQQPAFLCSTPIMPIFIVQANPQSPLRTKTHNVGRAHHRGTLSRTLSVRCMHCTKNVEDSMMTSSSPAPGRTKEEQYSEFKLPIIQHTRNARTAVDEPKQRSHHLKSCEQTKRQTFPSLTTMVKRFNSKSNKKTQIHEDR